MKDALGQDIEQGAKVLWAGYKGRTPQRKAVVHHLNAKTVSLMEVDHNWVNNSQAVGRKPYLIATDPSRVVIIDRLLP